MASVVGSFVITARHTARVKTLYRRLLKWEQNFVPGYVCMYAPIYLSMCYDVGGLCRYYTSVLLFICVHLINTITNKQQQHS
jgi:hypothetical protein